MLRLIIYIAIAAAALVFLRLLLVRLRMMRESQTQAAKSKVVSMPANGPLVIKDYFFANFAKETGPADARKFFDNLVVHVGPQDSARHREFSLWVTTPAALQSGPEGYRFGRGLLIVEEYDLELILKAVRQHIHELGLLANEVD